MVSLCRKGVNARLERDGSVGQAGPARDVAGERKAEYVRLGEVQDADQLQLRAG